MARKGRVHRRVLKLSAVKRMPAGPSMTEIGNALSAASLRPLSVTQKVPAQN
jgi:hypothetical protein